MYIDWAEVWYWVSLAIAGMLGALTRQLVIGRGNVVLWHRWDDPETGKHGYDLGILSSLFIGAVVGVLVDQSFFTAFTWAITGSYLIEEIMKREMNPKHPGGDGT